MEFVHEALADGIGIAGYRVVATGHSGEARKGAAIPGANPQPSRCRLGLVGDRKAGAGRADIGAAPAVVTALGERGPDRVGNFLALEAFDGLFDMNQPGKSTPGFQKGLVL